MKTLEEVMWFRDKPTKCNGYIQFKSNVTFKNNITVQVRMDIDINNAKFIINRYIFIKAPVTLNGTYRATTSKIVPILFSFLFYRNM